MHYIYKLENGFRVWFSLLTVCHFPTSIFYSDNFTQVHMYVTDTVQTYLHLLKISPALWRTIVKCLKRFSVLLATIGYSSGCLQYTKCMEDIYCYSRCSHKVPNPSKTVISIFFMDILALNFVPAKIRNLSVWNSSRKIPVTFNLWSPVCKCLENLAEWFCPILLLFFCAS